MGIVLAIPDCPANITPVTKLGTGLSTEGLDPHTGFASHLYPSLGTGGPVCPGIRNRSGSGNLLRQVV
jgi:hypothetical protein